ncbi:helix-turn-helix domain-containing protein [Amphritea sp. HPY]|uniref:helix-turn-helix transcriptional regulator n=1 Tax=Amphritea sp. HPY TaxID=3421652 RepID=UPI003D7EB7E8
MGNLSISWLDLRNDTSESKLAVSFSDAFEFQLFQRHQVSQDSLQQCRADIICFEYDYPDIPSLNLLQQMRKVCPDCPILMFTEQHSEALAVWAFRTGVWDFHVTPLSQTDVLEVESSLQNARCFRHEVGDRLPDGNEVRLPDEVRFRAPRQDKSVLQPAINYLEIHYNSKISEETLAGLCELSPSKFSRLFRQTFDITFQEYLIRYRLKQSCRLLLNPVASIADVAYSVGFNDPSYYARIFKKYIGQSPSVFRQQLQEGAGKSLSGELLDVSLSA